MIKTICDICGKEIDSIDGKYGINIIDRNNDYDTRRYEDVCINCANDVKNYIYKLKFNKGGD